MRREVAATAYRVVVEALTNVRRHAPDAGEVRVTVAQSAAVLTVEVVDDGGPRRAASGRSERGGLGLPGLTERVTSLGGTLSAGALDGGDGWRLAAELPVEDDGEKVAA